jgi:ABC-2 type transport system ATP-binding protein
MVRREFMRALFASPLRSDSPTRERTVLISSHLLSDLERVVTHVAFIRDGRLQCMDDWDAMLEHFRRLPPAIHDAWSNAVVWTNQQTRQRVVDTRRGPSGFDAGQPLSLDELFQEFNA